MMIGKRSKLMQESIDKYKDTETIDTGKKRNWNVKFKGKGKGKRKKQKRKKKKYSRSIKKKYSRSIFKNLWG